jgi:hypothetical protein
MLSVRRVMAMLRQLPVRSVVKGKAASGWDSFRVADRSSRIVAVVFNFEHLDELALGGYDCHRWPIS